MGVLFLPDLSQTFRLNPLLSVKGAEYDTCCKSAKQVLQWPKVSG